MILIRIVLIIVFIVSSLVAQAKDREDRQINIDFVMIRDAENSWDIKRYLIDQIYGDKIVKSSFRMIPESGDNYYGKRMFSHKTITEFRPVFEDGHRSMEITVCVSRRIFSNKSIDRLSCPMLFEKIRFQYLPDEVIKIQSLVEHDSRYEILVSEHTRKES